MSALPNETRQPTPVERMFVCWARVARHGYARRSSANVSIPMRHASRVRLRAAINGGSSKTSAQANLPPSPTLSPKAPTDQPVNADGKSEVEGYQTAIAPYVETGRKTYPEAKRRYL